MYISAVVASLRPHKGVSSPLHSAPYLLQKQRFINCSHLLASCACSCACSPPRTRVTELSLSAVALFVSSAWNHRVFLFGNKTQRDRGEKCFDGHADDRGSRWGGVVGDSITDKKLPAALCSLHLCQIKINKRFTS